jgi:hypothetical protein
MPNRPTLTKEQHEAWAREAGSRVLGLSLVRSMTLTGDGKKLAIYEFGNIIKVNPDWQGTTIFQNCLERKTDLCMWSSDTRYERLTLL